MSGDPGRGDPMTACKQGRPCLVVLVLLCACLAVLVLLCLSCCACLVVLVLLCLSCCACLAVCVCRVCMCVSLRMSRLGVLSSRVLCLVVSCFLCVHVCRFYSCVVRLWSLAIFFIRAHHDYIKYLPCPLTIQPGQVLYSRISPTMQCWRAVTSSRISVGYTL